MTRLPLLLLFVLPLSANAQALPDCSAGCTAAQLDALFDGGGPGLTASPVQGGLPAPAPAAAAAAVPPVSRPAAAALPAPAEAAAQRDGKVDQITHDMLVQMDLYASKPSKKQQETIDSALGMLNQTQFGGKLCASLRSECTYEELRKNGVEIRVIDKFSDANTEAQADMPRVFGYWKVVVLKKEYVDAGKSGVAASHLSHELTHVQDLNTYGPQLKNARLMAEDKALMSQLMIYSDLAAKFPGKVRSPVFDMAIALWRWKDDGVPFPAGLNYNGLSPLEFANKYFDKFDCVDDIVKGLNRNIFYPELKFAPTPGDVQSVGMAQRIRKDFRNEVIDYQEWRDDNGKTADEALFPTHPPQPQPQPQPGHTVPPLPGTTTPPQQPQPQQPQPQQPQPQQPQPHQPAHGGEEGEPTGGSGSGSGSGHNPGQYNPSFPQGTWPTGGL